MVNDIFMLCKSRAAGSMEQTLIKCDLRHISLTSVLSNVMESIVGEWLWEIVDPQIGSDQFGGLNGSSKQMPL